ncbi:hypothetical protein BDZ89DRAFT_1241497 [Hymenopellis radicata]|nr:hypothetical protein BDZ89DRAFT_1241497 [Hymenopellis radicata]
MSAYLLMRSLPYLGALMRACHVDDVLFAGRHVGSGDVEHANNVALFSMSRVAVQAKLDGFFDWCRRCFMTPTVAMFRLLACHALLKRAHPPVLVLREGFWPISGKIDTVKARENGPSYPK